MTDQVKTERTCIGKVICENCGGACLVYEAPKTGRLSYTCNECGSQFMARTQTSMRLLLDRVNKMRVKQKSKQGDNNHGQNEKNNDNGTAGAPEPKRTGTGGAFDWEW